MLSQRYYSGKISARCKKSLAADITQGTIMKIKGDLHMDKMQIIKTRKSVRTFNGEKITPKDNEKLLNYTKTIENPYNIPVEFMLLDREKDNLSSPVIEGEDTYIAAKVPQVKHCEEAYGYSFEKLILYAWSLGIGTTWIGGT